MGAIFLLHWPEVERMTLSRLARMISIAMTMVMLQTQGLGMLDITSGTREV